MAESPSQAPTQTTPTASVTDTAQYWCYHCEKCVSVETITNLTADVICRECKNGFVESIPATLTLPFSLLAPTPDHVDDPSLGSQFLQVLRIIAQASRDEDVPQPPTQDSPSEDDFLRIELDGWENEEDDDDDANENDENEENRNDDEEEDENENENEDDEENEGGEDRSDNENDENIENDDEEELRRRRQEVLRLRIQDFAARARRNRILDWAEILMGLEDNSIEFRLEVRESDGYIGNPEDYVDAAGYEALLQNLAESDGGRRGAPPAAKSAVLKLPTAEILTEQETSVCAICKDMVNIGETATKLPCGHEYHSDCIVPWLGSRNTCHVCRFELPTDDYEYEEERRKRVPAEVCEALGLARENSSLG